MIVVKIELWPVGDESKARCLGKAAIALQELSSDRTIGSYKYHLLKWRNDVSNRMDHSASAKWKEGSVGGHHRTNRGPWDLLYRVLRDAVGSRNKT